jgi:hypothetical protein
MSTTLRMSGAGEKSRQTLWRYVVTAIVPFMESRATDGTSPQYQTRILHQ